MSAGGEIVLVTGASGIIGRHAAPALARRGWRVITASRHGGDINCDLLDPGQRAQLMARARPTHWLHLAWETKHGHFWSAPSNLDWLAASTDLLRRFADAGGRRVVMAGTCAEYDWSHADGGPLSEDAPLKPATPYGEAKLALATALADFAAGAKLSYAWGRVFLLIGDGEHRDRLVPSLARALIAGKPAACGSGRQVRDFLDTRDAGAAFAALLAGDVQGAVNIASGKATAIADVATTLGRLAGRSDLVRLGALPDRAGEPRQLVADTSRLEKEVRFRAAIGLERALADALDYWRAEARAG
jgi:nucleoside-diphosphate-sugar epimerase